MRRHDLRPLFIFGVILAAAVAIHLPAILFTRPFSGDNLIILEWAHRTSLGHALLGDPEFSLEWRPIPHLLIWGLYRVWGVETLAPYLLVNVGIWAGALWLLHRLASARMTSSAGAAVAVAFLVTARPTRTITEYLMGSQTGLAVLFGLAAMNVALMKPPSRTRTLVVCALLILAGLGKEYGLAFAAGLGVWGFLNQRRDLTWAGAGALSVYLALRLSTSSAEPICEQQAFFGTFREVCLDRVGLSTVTQMAYNIAVGLAQSLLPGFFNGAGRIDIEPMRLLRSACALGIIVAGVRRRRLAWLALAVLVANAVLQAPLFRARNTVVGIAMLSLLVASGFQQVQEWSNAPARRRAFQVLRAGLVLVLLLRAQTTSRNISAAARITAIQNPCIELRQPVPVGADFVYLVKTAYSLPDPACTQPVVERFLP